MRKIYYLAMAMTLTIMVGCQNDDELLNVQNNVGQTFYATFENSVDTRTALDDNNNVLWSEGDQISVFVGTTANNSFILTSGKNTTYGEFAINTAAAGTETSSSAPGLSANVAYYPYSSDVTVSENEGVYTINATFPAEQTYSESGTFGIGASPMVAVTSSTLDANLKFKNVGAIFRLQLKGEATITKVVFSAEADLAGDCAITASNTSVPTVNVTNGSKTIILDCGDGVELSGDKATNFIIAMLPVEDVTGGITITIYDNAGKKMSYVHNFSTEITKIERSKAYTTEEVTYSGNDDANTPASVQAALDAATDGTTIQLEPGVNYGTLYIRQNANSTIVDITDVGGDAAGNEKYRKIENLTIIGAPGAVVDQIKFQASSWLANEINTEKYASYIDIKNLTVKNVIFSGEATAFNMDGSKSSSLGIEGLTIDGCTMNDADGKDRFVFQQMKGSNQLNDKTTNEYVMTTGVKNLTITNCIVTGAYQFIEAREMEKLTITNNTITNTAMHAILLTVNSGATYSGNITITGNTADGIGERFVRMAGAGESKVVINNNVITNYKGEDPDYIKVTDLTTNGTIETKNNTLEVSTAEALQAAIKYGGNKVVLAEDITVDKWIMFSETKTIANGNIITVTMDGLTIDGNGHTLTINSIESAGNGNLLFDGASELNIHNLTIKKTCDKGAIGLVSGIISKVNIEGGGYGIHPGTGEIKVENCTFATDDGDAIYFEQERDNLTVTGCTFNQQEGENVILLRGDVKFTNNIVKSGRTVNIVSGSPVVTGNNFNNVRLKVYSAATATISNNTINNLAFEEGKTTYASTFTNNTMSTEAQATLDAMTQTN